MVTQWTLLAALCIVLVVWLLNSPSEVYNLSGFSTKTAYRYCGLVDFVDKSSQPLEKCNLVHLNALFRHGTRAPSSKDIAKMKLLRDRLLMSAQYGAHLPSEFATHPIPFQDSVPKQLLPRGYEEHLVLGKRFQRLLKKFFTFSPRNIRFYSSSTNRAFFSAQAFYAGLFESDVSICTDVRNSQASCPLDPSLNYLADNFLLPNTDNIMINDTLLRFFAYCKRYIDEVDKNKTAINEFYKFKDSMFMQGILSNFLKKWKLHNTNYSVDDVRLIFSTCAYEVANAKTSEKLSPWCSFLRPQEFPVLEYLADLKQYWRKAYAFHLNYIQSCPLLGEMLAQIYEAAENYKKLQYQQSNPNLHRATFWFGHAETLLPVVTALGIFNESVRHDKTFKLRADNFSERLKQLSMHPHPPTMFRPGQIAPFAGNVAFLLYHCPDSVSDFHLEVRVNEKTVAWPLAGKVQPPSKLYPGSTSAPLSLVLNYFRNCMPNAYESETVCSRKNHTLFML